ncbi:hypothetical protein B0H14DRAFT_2738911 [Mycena olivaceomarginata]|nr:hypothetical protein B0H14DRAFT_2738911 [Mycena olivaceomarginata]
MGSGSAIQLLAMGAENHLQFPQQIVRTRHSRAQHPRRTRYLVATSRTYHGGGPFSNRLSSLHLEGSGEWSVVWCMLQTGNHDSDSRTKLTEITTNGITQDLLAYLASYSGIRKLALKAPDGGSRVQSDRLADMFFEAVLPRHGTTLTDLSCPAAYESQFSFLRAQRHFASLLHNLSSLEMSINAGAVRRVDPPTEWVDAGRVHHQLVSVGITVEVEQADIDPVVVYGAALPTLRRLAVVPAETERRERNRGAKCGNGRMQHQSAVRVAIAHAVRAFRSDVPCAAVVYELQRLLEGMLGYRQTGEVPMVTRRRNRG